MSAYTDADAGSERMTPRSIAFFTAFAGVALMVLGILLSSVLGVIGLLISGVGALMMFVSLLIWIILRLKAR